MKRALLVAVAATWIGAAAAQQELGVQVYPGAKPHADTTEFLQKSLKMKGTAYVTGDPVAKVVDFYKRQPGLTQNPGADSTQAGFSGKGVMVTVQNPWLDMKNSKKVESTLISIVKQ